MGGLKIEDFDELWIRDRHGKRVQITPLAANARRRFRRLNTFALKRIQDSPEPLDALYDKDDVFREVTDESLALFDLKPEDFDLGRIVTLLYSREVLTEDGESVTMNGLLVSLEFPSAQFGEPLDEDLDPDDYGAAVVWIASGNSLGETLDDLDRLPGRRVDSIIRHRGVLLEKAAERAKKEAEERIGQRSKGSPSSANLKATKQLQREVLGQLQAEGKLSLDDDNQWVPIPPPI